MTTTKSDLTQTLFAYAKESTTGKITRVAVPTDFQVGVTNQPADLQLLGGLSLSSRTQNVSDKSIVEMTNHDTIVCLNATSIVVSGSVYVNLPSSPRDGQYHILKDINGFADQMPITVRPHAGASIDGNVMSQIQTSRGSMSVFWRAGMWCLISTGGTTIITSGSTGGTSGGGDPNATYVVMSTTASLNAERTLNPGTGLRLVDGGPNGNVTLLINDNTVATVSGTTFTGPVSAGNGLSGSLQQTTAGLSYLVAGDNVTITSQSNGQVRISSIDTGGGTGADPGATYLVVSTTGSLPNERSLAQGTGISFTDAGAGSTFTVGINNNVVATVSGTTFTGPVIANSGLSGSLQQTTSGLSYLIGGNNITVTSQSNGQVRFDGAVMAPVSAQYLVLGSDATLTQERVFSASTGLRATDAGANGSYTLSINDNIVATVSGTRFTGPVSASGGLTGSLQQVSSGLPYLVAGVNVSITTQSNGQVLITGTGGGGDAYASYIVLNTTSSLVNERALSAGTGILLTDAGAGGNVTVSINDNVVATVSGTRFTGPVSASSGLSGSLQQIAPGLPYLVAGANVVISTGSNGQVSIAAIVTGSGGGDASPSFVVISSTGSLTNERVLAAGAGLSLVDGGPNGNVTLSLNQAILTSGSMTLLSSSSPAYLPQIDGYTAIYWPFESVLSASGIALQAGMSSSLLLALTATSPTSVRLGRNSVYSGMYGLGAEFNHGHLASQATDAVIGGNKMTLSLWTRPITTGSGLKKIITKDYATGSWISPFAAVSIYQESTDNSRVEYGLTTDAGSRITMTSSNDSSLKLQNEQWNHVALTYDGENVKGFINGLLAAQTPKTGNIDWGASPGGWFIGGNHNDSEFFSGSIDEIRVEAITRTPEYIRQLYESGIHAHYVSESLNVAKNLFGSLVTGSTFKRRIDPDQYDVAVWIMNDASGSQIFANTGISSSYAMTASSVSGAGSGARQFFGGVGEIYSANGYFTSNQSRLLHPTGSINDLFTISTWVNLKGYTAFGKIFFKSTNDTTWAAPFYQGMGLLNTGDGRWEIAHNGVAGAIYPAVGANVAGKLPLNEWCHIGYTYDGTSIRGYLNGMLVISATHVTPTRWGAGDTDGGPWSLGGNPQNTSEYLSGYLADARIAFGVARNREWFADTYANGMMRITGTIGGISVGSLGGGGDSAAPYLTLAATASLSNERVLSVSGSTGLRLFDSGSTAGSVVLSINNDIVATVSGTTFTGVTKHNAGLSGSLTRLVDGTSYLIAGDNITLTSQSNGSVKIDAATGGGGSSDANASFVVLSATGSLLSERVLTAGPGITLTDTGAGGQVIISSSNGWVTAYDINFTTLSSLTCSAGNNTIGPISFNFQNATNADFVGIVPGEGLRFDPNATASDYYLTLRTMPYLRARLSDIIPGYNLGDYEVRIWSVFDVFNADANFELAVCGIDKYNFASNGQQAMFAMKGYNSFVSASIHRAHRFLYGNTDVIYTHAPATAHVQMVHMTSMRSHQFYHYDYPLTSSAPATIDWPAQNIMTASTGFFNASSSPSAFFTYISASSDTAVILGAYPVNTANSFSASFKQLRIDYRNKAL
jgi:hypothetical protein